MKVTNQSSQEKYRLDTSKMESKPLHDRELELDVLACIVFNESNYSEILLLDSHDFYSIDNRQLFEAFRNMYANDGIINMAILPTEYKELQGYHNLYNRNDYVITSQVDISIKRLKDISNARKLQDISYRATLKAAEGIDPIVIKEWIIRESEKISDVYSNKEITTNDLDNTLEEFLIDGSSPSILTGFKKFDEITGGFMKGTMTIVASAQGIGKTTLAINILNYMCKQGKKVLYVSLEMSFMALHAKMVSNLSGVSFYKMMFKNKELNSDEWSRIHNARAKISEYSLYRLGERDITTSDIRAKLKDIEVDIIIIDYMQLIKPSIKGSLYETATNTSRDLKMLSNEFNIPFIVIASINRDYSDRGDFTPRISDIRHSGQIEYDADLVLLLHRNSAFREYDSTKDKNEYMFRHTAEMIIAKNRYGESNLKIEFYFDGEKSIFKEMDDYEQS